MMYFFPIWARYRRNTRALHYLVCIEDELFCMLSLLKWYIPLVEYSSIFLRYLAHI